MCSLRVWEAEMGESHKSKARLAINRNFKANLGYRVLE